MTRTLENRPISDWRPGDEVAGFALVTRKEERLDRRGRAYLDLELADVTGHIDAKAFPDSEAANGDFEAHDFVAFAGLVHHYRDHLQLVLSSCRRAGEEDRDAGFEESILVPTAPADLEALWHRLGELLELVGRPELRRLAQEVLTEHGAALREHPAARSIHHAYRGGLLEHVVAMSELAVEACRLHPFLDRDLLLLGVLLHDLGKLEELGAMPVNDYTPPGRLVGHLVLGRDLLQERCAAIPGFPQELRLALEHLILSHHGSLEYGSPVEPMTAEAVALSLLDRLDSRLNQLRAIASEGSGFRYIRRMGREVYVPPDAAAAAGAGWEDPQRDGE